MKKTMKFASVLLIAIFVVVALTTTTMAKVAYNDVIGGMDAQQANSQTTSEVSKIFGNIANILTTVGIAIAVIVLVVLGIKYMIGSASEKAEYKKTMIPYIIGALLIAGASAIVRVIFSFKIGG